MKMFFDMFKTKRRADKPKPPLIENQPLQQTKELDHNWKRLGLGCSMVGHEEVRFAYYCVTHDSEKRELKFVIGISGDGAKILNDINSNPELNMPDFVNGVRVNGVKVRR
jgi:hypothetical protein